MKGPFFIDLPMFILKFYQQKNPYGSPQWRPNSAPRHVEHRANGVAPTVPKVGPRLRTRLRRTVGTAFNMSVASRHFVTLQPDTLHRTPCQRYGSEVADHGVPRANGAVPTVPKVGPYGTAGLLRRRGTEFGTVEFDDAVKTWTESVCRQVHVIDTTKSRQRISNSATSNDYYVTVPTVRSHTQLRHRSFTREQVSPPNSTSAESKHGVPLARRAAPTSVPRLRTRLRRTVGTGYDVTWGRGWHGVWRSRVRRSRDDVDV